MDKSVGRMASILYRKDQIYLNIVLKPYGITASEVPILNYLFWREGVAQEEVCTYLAIDKGAMARAVQTMIEKDLVRKEPDPEDRRANKLYPTQKALDLKACIGQRLHRWSEYLTEGLDEETIEIMYQALDHMVKKIEKTDMHSIWRED